MGLRTVALVASIGGICSGALTACGTTTASPGHARTTQAGSSTPSVVVPAVTHLPADLDRFEFGRVVYVEATVADLDKLRRHSSEAGVLRGSRGVETVSLAYATDTLNPRKLDHHLVWVLVNRHAKEPVFGSIGYHGPSEVDAMAVTLIDAADGSFISTQMGPPTTVG